MKELRLFGIVDDVDDFGERLRHFGGNRGYADFRIQPYGSRVDEEVFVPCQVRES